MRNSPHALDNLVAALHRLPGVGVKSATRMAFHLLQHDPEGARHLAQALVHACDHVQHCRMCNTFTEQEVCETCQDESRDRSKLCVVESPADQSALERTQVFNGLYYVLMGKLSPLDGIGPKDIGMQQLLTRATQPEVQEVILATNFTAEGEVTAHVLSERLKVRGIKVTRLARGVPAGSELEYVDLGTIAHALHDRR